MHPQFPAKSNNSRYLRTRDAISLQRVDFKLLSFCDIQMSIKNRHFRSMKKSFGTYTFIITIAIVYSIPVLDKSKRNIESHEEYINVYI